jgi:hypothetical protein
MSLAVIYGSLQKSFCTDRVVLNAALLGINESPFGNAASYLERNFCLSWSEHERWIMERAALITMFCSRGCHDANFSSIGSNLSCGLIRFMAPPGLRPCYIPPMGGKKGSTFLR